MLDTNVFDPTEDFSCYSVFEKDKEGNTRREDFIQKQKDFILGYFSTINTKNIQNICFFGHHPLLSYKIKKEKVKIEDSNMELHSFLLDILVSNNLQERTIYYFCAHLHQYQKGIVTISQNEDKIIIHQYISGTGGAHLDPKIPKKYIKIEEKVDYKDNIVSSYQMLESISINGFLMINIIKSNILVEFYPVFLLSLSKKKRSRSRYNTRKSKSLGGKTKRKSKKNKY
jgi:hypothetical protein